MRYLRLGKKDIDLGLVHPQDCEVCQREQPFRLRLVYCYEHLFFVFGNARRESYALVCEVCGTPYRIPRDVAFKLGRLDRDPIPFLQRYGCMVLWLIFLVVALVGVILEQ